MKKEYDFSKAERGKFYHKGARLRLPIYLDFELQNRLQKIAQKNHKDFAETANHLLKKEIDLIQHFI